MPMKRMLIVVLLYFSVVSCASPSEPITAIPVITLTASSTKTALPIIAPESTMTEMLVPPLTPEVTATPVAFNIEAQSLIPVIAEMYHRSVACLTDNEYDMPNNVTGLVKPEFIDVTDDVENAVEIEEIADNTKNTYRAYLAVCKTYWDCKYGLSQLHLENRLNGRTYIITWKGFEAITAHWNLIWIGEDIIAYMHILDPRREEIIAINVKTEEFAYVGQAWAYCVEP